MPFPFLVEAARGSVLRDIDGNEYADFCLGDTASMFGHSPAPVAEAIARQASRGLTYMLPTEDAIAVGRLLVERFGLPHWQVATTATDANRFALRVARAVTGRPKILVFNGCYHGTVDETFVRLVDGRAVNRPGLLGQVDRPDATRARGGVQRPAGTRARAVSRRRGVRHHRAGDDELVHGVARRRLSLRIAAPDPRDAGTLLLIDETHTISTGPGGYTRAHGLEPDLFVLGKPVAGGVPASVWGFTDDVARRLDGVRAQTPPGHSGMGTTLSANALSLAAMRATLEQVMTGCLRAHGNARRSAGCRAAAVIGRCRPPWHVVRVGARVEFICAPGPLRNGTQAEAAHAPALERAVHLALLNRGCLIAPFHNMMLVCPATTATQVDALCAAFAEIALILTNG